MKTPGVFGKLGRPRQRGLGSAVFAVFAFMLAQGCGNSPAQAGVSTGVVSDGTYGADQDTAGQTAPDSDADTVKTGLPSAHFQSSDPIDAPNTATFPSVAPNTAAEREVKLLNMGESLLTITGFDLTGLDPSFSLKLDDPPNIDSAWHLGGALWTLPKVLEIAPGSSATLRLKFSPQDDKKKSGVVSIQKTSNDPQAADLVVGGNNAIPCLKISETTHDFGAVSTGSSFKLAVDICNCGPVELDVTGIDPVAAQTTSAEFAVDQQGLYATGKLTGPPPISAGNPLKIAAGQCQTVSVSYTPSDVTPQGDAPDKATFAFASNAFVTPTLQASGVGVGNACPIAKVLVLEGQEVPPQTLLHLSGGKSTAPGGSIKKYLWSVKQPPGSNQPLLPNASFANPTLLANAAGTYTFCLQVWDQNDQPGCAPACETVLVIPNTDIHIELLWNTPADPDQFDTGPAAGADLDLHFAHPMAAELDLDCDGKPDPWFSNPWDTFWFNATPEWGSPSAAVKDNPSLDLDDTDGAGPENLNLSSPEGTLDEPVAYSVGAHYWNDHGYGTSYATVAIYVQGGLVVQFASVKLEPLDLWYVGKLWWPNALTGGSKPVFQACHQSGLSCPAKKNLMWQASGTECITPCYSNAAFVGAVSGGASKPGWCK